MTRGMQDAEYRKRFCRMTVEDDITSHWEAAKTVTKF